MLTQHMKKIQMKKIQKLKLNNLAQIKRNRKTNKKLLNRIDIKKQIF